MNVIARVWIYPYSIECPSTDSRENLTMLTFAFCSYHKTPQPLHPSSTADHHPHTPPILPTPSTTKPPTNHGSQPRRRRPLSARPSSLASRSSICPCPSTAALTPCLNRCGTCGQAVGCAGSAAAAGGYGWRVHVQCCQYCCVSSSPGHCFSCASSPPPRKTARLWVGQHADHPFPSSGYTLGHAISGWFGGGSGAGSAQEPAPEAYPQQTSGLQANGDYQNSMGMAGNRDSSSGVGRTNAWGDDLGSGMNCGSVSKQLGECLGNNNGDMVSLVSHSALLLSEPYSWRIRFRGLGFGGDLLSAEDGWADWKGVDRTSATTTSSS